MTSEKLPPAPPRHRIELTFDDDDESSTSPVALPSAVPPPVSETPSAPPPPTVATGPSLPRVIGHAPPPPAAGYSPNAVHPMAVAAMSMNRKSPGVAVLLSLLVTGAGQVYCGRAARGAAFFAAGFCAAVSLLFIIGFVLLPIIWIWAAIDAASVASRQNETLLAAMAGR